jgi:aspartyl-tRNA synthetase
LARILQYIEEMKIYRTHTCGELRKTDIGLKAVLSGWLHNRRDHGGVLFIDLRDFYGITQVVIRPQSGFLERVSHLAKETVIRFSGKIRFRDKENINPNLPTGEIELEADSYEVLNKCAELPFNVFPEHDVSEDVRLKYRYLDLRRSRMRENIILRSRVISAMRRHMLKMGFHEFQTPILTASSPEGARDYLIPSRLHVGKFYALPQAPQLYKQLIMIAGFDKYFQIAPCFRDEDSRADRSPGEFYQLDLEMSFVTQEDIFRVVEKMIKGVFKEFDKKISKVPFKRIKYAESMLKYGTDKPDLRIPLQIHDVSTIFKDSEFQSFSKIVRTGGVVRAIPVKAISERPRSFFDNMVEYAISMGSKGLAYLVWNGEGVKGPIAKFVCEDRIKVLAKSCAVEVGDVIFFICHQEKEANRLAADIRVKLGKELKLIKSDKYEFCWIVDYPMFEQDPITGKPAFSHNPFSMPQGGVKALKEQDPSKVLAYQYDLVCNGVELSSGAIRNHQPEIMYKAFAIAGYDKEAVDKNFGALIKAFKLGAPPHGGIAPGIDRIIMLMAGEENIREVIAFPLNQNAYDPLLSAPREVSAEQLRELHLRTIMPVKRKAEKDN